MAITITCPSCKQLCNVAEEHAGLQVRCPHCSGIITVPGMAPAAPVYTPAAPPPGMPPPPLGAAGAPPRPEYSAPPGKSPFASLDDAARAVGMDKVSTILFYCGL